MSDDGDMGKLLRRLRQNQRLIRANEQNHNVRRQRRCGQRSIRNKL